MSSALWEESVRELVCHLALQRNGYVVKEVHGSRAGSPKFKDGRPFLILFFSSLPGLYPLPSAAWTQKRWGRRMESPMFSVIYKLVDQVLSLKRFHLFFLLFSALESECHYLDTHASTHRTATFYQRACCLWQIFRRKGFCHRFSSLWELWDSAIPWWQKTSLLSNTRPWGTVPALKM